MSISDEQNNKENHFITDSEIMMITEPQTKKETELFYKQMINHMEKKEVFSDYFEHWGYELYYDDGGEDNWNQTIVLRVYKDIDCDEFFILTSFVEVEFTKSICKILIKYGIIPIHLLRLNLLLDFF